MLSSYAAPLMGLTGGQVHVPADRFGEVGCRKLLGKVADTLTGDIYNLQSRAASSLGHEASKFLEP